MKETPNLNNTSQDMQCMSSLLCKECSGKLIYRAKLGIIFLIFNTNMYCSVESPCEVIYLDLGFIDFSKIFH